MKILLLLSALVLAGCSALYEPVRPGPGSQPIVINLPPGVTNAPASAQFVQPSPLAVQVIRDVGSMVGPMGTTAADLVVGAAALWRVDPKSPHAGQAHPGETPHMIELATLVLTGIVVPIAAWTLKEVIDLKVRDAGATERVNSLERRLEAVEREMIHDT